MLSRTPISELYLTAEQLGIRQDEYEALLWVREELDAGRIEYSKNCWSMDTTVPKTHFNMSAWSCGSAVCIGGWMEVRGPQTSEKPSLQPLFFPHRYMDLWLHNLTPAQAVRAIDHWLSGAGENCWKLALETEGDR